MLAMLIGLNKIPKISFMAAFATSLLSIVDPHTNFDPSLGLELGLGLGFRPPAPPRPAPPRPAPPPQPVRPACGPRPARPPQGHQAGGTSLGFITFFSV